MFDPNFEGTIIFADINEEGDIKDALVGKRILPDRQYDYFFYVEQEVSENIDDYKVVLEGLKPQLVKK